MSPPYLISPVCALLANSCVLVIAPALGPVYGCELCQMLISGFLGYLHSGVMNDCIVIRSLHKKV